MYSSYASSRRVDRLGGRSDDGDQPPRTLVEARSEGGNGRVGDPSLSPKLDMALSGVYGDFRGMIARWLSWLPSRWLWDGGAGRG
jgi:hypothetical protein